MSMERELSSGFELPPGFRFHPSDEELIIHYLQNKVTSRPLPASIIAEIDLYKHNPWELPKKALFGDEEWYFFSPRDRKYPKGTRPNRAARSGYWKATGTDRPIITSGSKNIGVKKALVFYTGRPPNGLKTDWIMNEYRLPGTAIKPARLKGSMRLDEWVLCRVRQKGNVSKNTYEVQESPNKELVRHSSKVKEVHPTHSSYNTDMITEFLSKDCQLLASILSGKSLPPIETISSVSFQGSNKGNSSTSVYEDSKNEVNYPITVSSFEKSNPSKRNCYEEDGCNNIFPSNKKLKSGNRIEDLPPTETLPDNNVNYYGQNWSEDWLYDPSHPLDPITSFLELDDLNFTSYGNEHYPAGYHSSVKWHAQDAKIRDCTG